jgi:endoglucanase
MGGQGTLPTGPTVGTPVQRFGHLKLSGAALVSESGEPVQLRGVSSMWLNWEDDGYATDKASLFWMRDNWNLQVIRAAMGVDVDGGYSSTAGKVLMLARVEQIILNAVEAGVYVIVDFHSHNAHQFQADAVEFFSTIMQKYGQLPNLILEPFNEPLPNLTWAGDLRPYHVSLLETIRQNDPDDHPNITVLGTPSYDQKPDEAVGSPIVDDAVMYAVHFYSCTHGAAFRDRAKTALSQGLPLFVTEWGATQADGGVKGSAPCYDEANLWLDFLATNRISWTAWKLDNCGYEKGQNGVEDTSCILKAETRIGSGFPENVLNGHGSYVVQRMLCE